MTDDYDIEIEPVLCPHCGEHMKYEDASFSHEFGMQYEEDWYCINLDCKGEVAEVILKDNI